MRLFNSLGRKVEEFKPLAERNVKLYTCGPTVYDTAQIGNLRTFVFYDTLRRALQAGNYEVDHVMNITDVGHLTSDGDEGDDKLEKGAKREGKTVWQIAEHYTDLFMADMQALNNLPPRYAKATDFIEPQIELVKQLLAKDFAYQTEQAIYFDVSKLADYGKLTGQKLIDKETAVRAEVVKDSAKRNPEDFAVWFFTVGKYADHAMHWPSPWGQGFPGWHLECSAIIHATLNEPIDIHAGGVDLIGTHHTNEMAQTEAAYDVELANYWLHGEHLLVDGKKMSKSSGSFITLKDITDKGYDPLALRLLFLQAHYRSQMNFTWEALDATQTRLNKYLSVAALRHQKTKLSEYAQSTSLQRSIGELIESSRNDLNTPELLAKIDSEVEDIEYNGLIEGAQNDFLAWLETVDNLTGLNLLQKTPDIKEETKQLVIEREAARESKDFAKSDDLRDELANQGIGLRDTDYGPIWYRL